MSDVKYAQIVKADGFNREELQAMAEVLNTEVIYHGEVENGFEQVAFSPKAWAKNSDQPRLFEPEE